MKLWQAVWLLMPPIPSTDLVVFGKTFRNTLPMFISLVCPPLPVLLITVAAAAAKSLQLCPTLCNPIDGSPPGSRIPGILQARTLEWVAISFSNA